MTGAVGVLAPLLRGDEHFAVTGATGWFGATALDLLDTLLGAAAAERRVSAFGSRASEVTTRSGRQVVVHPLEDLATHLTPSSYLLHFAFATRDRSLRMAHGDYVTANLRITSRVLGAVSSARPRGIVVTSSGASRGPGGRPRTDLDDEPYGVLKHLDELVFRQAAADAGSACAVARVYSVAGARMTKPEAYALGSFIQMAQQGGPIVVRATGPVVRSYVGVEDVITLALWAVMRKQSVTFDSGGEPVEIGVLAAEVAQAHDLSPAGSVSRPPLEDKPEDRYAGAADEMNSLAEEAGLVLRSRRDLIVETSRWLCQDGARSRGGDLEQ